MHRKFNISLPYLKRVKTYRNCWRFYNSFLLQVSNIKTQFLWKNACSSRL